MRIFYVSVIALLLFNSTTLSNEVEQSEAKKASPTLITSDGSLEVDYNEKIAYFQDNVVVTDPQGKVKADKMKVFFSNENNEVKEIECNGNVKIFHEGRYSESDEAIYYAQENKIILTGNPVIRQKNDYYSADKITIFAVDNRVLFEPSARLLIYPDKQENPGMNLLGKESSE